MREILFRGLHNGKFIYGNYVKFGFSEYIVVGGSDLPDMTFYEVKECKIDQYTGFKDSNGDKVFERDILEVHGSTKRKYIDVVVWDAEFCSFCLKNSDNMLDLDSNKIRIIGNMHQNTELLQ